MLSGKAPRNVLVMPFEISIRTKTIQQRLHFILKILKKNQKCFLSSAVPLPTVIKIAFCWYIMSMYLILLVAFHYILKCKLTWLIQIDWLYPSSNPSLEQLLADAEDLLPLLYFKAYVCITDEVSIVLCEKTNYHFLLN